MWRDSGLGSTILNRVTLEKGAEEGEGTSRTDTWGKSV